MPSVPSASGMEQVHGSMQTGKDYSNTTVNSQYFIWQVFVTVTAK